MAVKARSYEAANIVLSVLGVFAWLQIALGLFGVFAGGLGGSSQLEVTITIGMKFLSVISVLSGLVSLALVQMARANVHSAEINWEMLQILRQTSPSSSGIGQNTGEPSRLGIGAKSPSSASSNTAHGKSAPPSFDENGMAAYRGRVIRCEGDNYHVDQDTFGTLKAAIEFVDLRS